MNATIISCTITGIITLAVCLINNAVTIRKNRDEQNQHMQDQINNIKDDINENLADITARLEEMIANQETQQAQIKGEMELQTYRIVELDKKVEKHNNVIERTYNLEKTSEILTEKLRVANARIADLERENEKK